VVRYWHRQRECRACNRAGIPPVSKTSAMPRWVPELDTEIPVEKVMVAVA
jgi:hypothetical protein